MAKKKKVLDESSVKKKYVRIILIPIIGLVVVSAVFIYTLYNVSFKNIQNRELKRLSAVVNTLSQIVDGEQLEELITEFPNKDDITDNGENPEYLEIHKLLLAAQKSNNLPTDIYILSKKADAAVINDSFFFSVSSGTPYYRHDYTPPEKLYWEYNYEGVIEPYQTENGTWISAYAPIKNSLGKVIGVVEADVELSAFYSEASDELWELILPIALLIIVLVAIIGFAVNYTIKAIVKYNNDLTQVGIDKLEKTQQTIKEFTSSIEEGNYEREIEGVNEESEDAIISSLLKMRESLKKSSEEDKIRKWSNEGLARFAEILRKDNDNIEKLGHNIIVELVKYINANQASLFVLEQNEEGNDVLVMRACYAFERRKYLEKAVEIGEGLVGQCFLERDTIYLKEIPGDYVNITSGLGDAPPRNILIVPLQVNEEIYGVIEIAAFNKFNDHVVNFVEKIAENIGSTLHSVRSNYQTKKLLDESKELTENLQSQEEEMRQNMEEMSATQEEMQRNRARLEKTQERNKFIIDCMSEMIILADKNGNINEVNAKFFNTLSYKKEEIEGMNINSIIPSIDISNAQTYLWNINRFDVVCKNGEHIATSVFLGETVNDEGESTYAAIIKDLTELIQVEKERNSYKEQLEEAEKRITELQP